MEILVSLYFRRTQNNIDPYIDRTFLVISHRNHVQSCTNKNKIMEFHRDESDPKHSKTQENVCLSYIFTVDGLTLVLGT